MRDRLGGTKIRSGWYARAEVAQPEAEVAPASRRLIRAAEFLFAAAMRLAPRRYRFGAAVFVARAATPLLRLTDAYRKQELIGFDGAREIALHFVLNALTRNGARFDPVVEVRGFAELERACAAGTGVLVIGPHAALTLLMIRLFYDRGLDPVVITPDPGMRVAGTTLTVRTVQPSPTFLVKTRGRLRRGELVCAMPDRAEHHGARTVEFVTVNGRVIVAPALMHVAARCGARVIFTEAHADGGSVVGTIHAPADASSGNALTEEFIAFVQERASIRSAGRGMRMATEPIKNGKIGDKINSALASTPRVFGRRLSAPLSGGRLLLVAAAVLHVALALGLHWAGHAQLVPSFVDHDGIMASFAFDSYEYQRGAVRLAEVLRQDGVSAWAAERGPIHVRLISLQFALVGPLLGYGTLSAEPFNLLCYLAVVGLTLLLGREIGGRRAGLLAAGAVALWPTFLLHTLQLLKDPLFIAGALALVLCVTTWLTRDYGRASAAGAGALMGASILLLLLIRFQFAAVILVLVLLGFAMLVVRQVAEGRVLYWNMISPLLILAAGALLLLLYSLGAPVVQKFKRYPSDGGGLPKLAASAGERVPTVVTYLPRPKAEEGAAPGYAARLRAAADRAAHRVGSVRYRFGAVYSEAGSGVDRNVRFDGLAPLLLYLPRAFVIGCCAPFPNMWVAAGRRVGSAGKSLSGAETLIMYVFGLLALVAVLRRRRRLAAWLLLSVTVFGVTALGLVVPNVGALYRFRYTFWVLLIILAAKGIEGALTSAGRWREAGSSG